MVDQNPYSPSRASLNLSDPVSRADDGGTAVWRDGAVLIKLHDAAMPNRCVKCNRPAAEPTKARKVYWHHPALYLLVLLNIIVYAIVAAVLRKNAFVSAGLCVEHKRRRRIALVLCWTGALSGIVLMYFGMDSSWGVWGVLVGALLILASALGGLIFARIVYARKIDKIYVRLNGCGMAFLDSLQQFSGEAG